jgi:hypothetical protein
VTWPWPVGVRRVLAGAAILAAMALALASRLDPPSSAETFAIAPELVVDPNTAPPHVLTALPHIGPTLVRALLAAREDRPFPSLEDAQDRVRGLGPATLVQIAPHFTFEQSIQSEAYRIASSSSDPRAAKSRSTRRKATRSKLARQASQSPDPRLVADSSEPDTRQPLSIARQDR